MEPITKNVSGVQFSIMGPEEIRNSSSVEITKFETYDKDMPVIKGLFDLRMGTTDMGKVCNTCGQTNIECPGHFGHIELARPVYHYHFIQRVIKILKCVCIRCSQLLLNKEHPMIESIKNKSPKVRWSKLYNLSSKITRCGQETEHGCGCSQPKRYKVDGIKGIKAIWNQEDTFEHEINIEYIKSVLEKISNEDCNLLGFSNIWSRPEWLICSVLPVPPPSVRPSVKQDNSQRMDDDLTHKLSDIVKYNNGLKHKIEMNSRPEIIQDWTDMLQYHIGTLIDNELPGINQSTHRSGRPLKAIRQRLKGKEGRIRSNLMGKRVDFSARSVITPDPNIELDQLGVPIQIAMNLTYPEKVNEYNKHRLLEYVRNGSMKWPGVKNIIQQMNNIKISVLDTNKDEIELSIGDIVNRHLIDNDYVLFNRQPSLHKMSMMGHRVRVMKGNTFRLNISVTPPYNADFDGDEMNMHVPQSISAVCELINIACVKNQILSPRTNKPIITLVQDSLLGLSKLTNSDVIHYNEHDNYYYSNNTNIYPLERNGSKTKLVQSSLFTRKQIMNILSDVSTFQGSIPDPEEVYVKDDTKIELWTGRQVISFILPENINLKIPNGSFDNNKDSDNSDTIIKKGLSDNNNIINIISIVNGTLENGTFDKSILTKTSNGIIHTMYNDLGKDRTSDFINDLQQIITYFLLLDGFSVGISDMIADEYTNKKINETIKDRKEQINVIMQELHLNIFERIPGKSKNDFFESKVNSILNKTRKDTGKIGLSNLDTSNRMTKMINSGSKGNDLNIAQMVACLGQQNVDGKRIPYGFTDRTLPHYYKYDDSAEARGFVENSFISGQTPQEFYFHAMGGREGLIDTAVKTSETGYIQRKLVKAMEDLMVHYDYSVRSSSGAIVQFIYGNDGMDGTYVESQSLLVTKYTLEEIIDKLCIPSSYKWKEHLTKTAYSEFMKRKKHQDIIDENNNKIINHRSYLYSTIFQKEAQNNINFPVHLERIISNICKSSTNKSDISPLDIIHQNELLVEQLFVRDEFRNNKMMEILIDIHMCPKLLIDRYHIQKDEYTMILTLIKQQYYKSKICPGEMVGAVAAQSIGEPATQMSLNTFHYAGVSAKSNVTRGIPRLKELLHISKNIKSPSCTVYLHDDFKNDMNKAQFVKNNISFTLLKDIVSSSKIYYDPLNMIHETSIEEDKELLSIFKQFQDLETSESEGNISPWIIRYEFDKEVMMEKGILLEDVYISLMNYDSECIRFIYSDDNASTLIGRLSIKLNIKNDISDNGLLDQSDIISSFKNANEDIMNNVIIRGIHNITDIIVNEVQCIETKEHNIEKVKNYVLETDGTNLLELFTHPYVNFKETYSNDIIETYNLLGIEAARNILYEQIEDVFEEYINNRHIELLCDVMTSKGYLIQINRQGVDRGDMGPLAKCSFEDTTDQLIKASLFGERDNLYGVSSNIMLGQTIPCGTGYSEILLDEEKMIQELSNLQNEDEDEYDEVNEDNIDLLMNEQDDEGCNDDNFKFDFE